MKTVNKSVFQMCKDVKDVKDVKDINV